MLRLTAVCAAVALSLTACASDTTNPNASLKGTYWLAPVPAS